MRGAGLFLLIAGTALTGCSDDEDGDHIVPPGGGKLVGISDTIPRIEGTWRFVDMEIANSCGSISDLIPDTASVQITQANNDLQIKSFSVCGNPIATSEGAITATNLISAGSERTVVLTDQCSVVLELSLTGSANDLGNHFEGGATLKITPVVSPLVECGAGYPCQFDSTFVADRCPPADCTLPPCSPS